MSAARRLAAVPDQPGRAVLYVRVSALMGRGGDDFHSPDVQLAAMRGAIAGMREVAVVEDIDQTGRHFARDGIEQIRMMAQAKQIDAIAVYDISRLGRNVLESLLFLRELAQQGVTIISACERLDTSTPEGQMMLINMLNLAEYRSREIGRNWSNTIGRRAARGQYHGRPPTGYARGDGGRLVPDPTVGPAVREAFLDYVHGGTSRGIRRRLRELTGLELHASTWKNMLANPAYRGHTHVAGRIVAEHTHEALMDEPTWQKVRRRLAADACTPAHVLSPQYSVTGLGRCAECEQHTFIRGGSRSPRLHCRRQYWSLDRDCTGCGGITVAQAEEEILAQVRKHIQHLRTDRAAQSARAARASRASADAKMLKRELEQTQRAMVRLSERWAREQISDAVYAETMASLRADEARLDGQIGQRQEAAAGPPPAEQIRLAEKLLVLWPEMDAEQRNRALRDVIDHFVVRAAAHYREPAGQRVTAIFRGDTD